MLSEGGTDREGDVVGLSDTDGTVEGAPDGEGVGLWLLDGIDDGVAVVGFCDGCSLVDGLSLVDGVPDGSRLIDGAIVGPKVGDGVDGADVGNTLGGCVGINDDIDGLSCDKNGKLPALPVRCNDRPCASSFVCGFASKAATAPQATTHRNMRLIVDQDASLSSLLYFVLCTLYTVVVAVVVVGPNDAGRDAADDLDDRSRSLLVVPRRG